MRVFTLLLALVALLTACGAAAYGWLQLQHMEQRQTLRIQQQLLEDERRINDLLRDQEQKMASQRGDLTNRLVRLEEQQKHSEQQVAAARENSQTQLAALGKRLEKFDDSLQQTNTSWLLENIAGTVQVIERTLYLRQSLELTEQLVDKAFLLIDRLPAAQSALLTAALERDRERLQELRLKDLPSLSEQLNAVGILLSSLPHPCCADFQTPPLTITEGNVLEWLQQLLSQTVRLRRIDQILPAQPNRYEQEVLRAGLELYLAQARSALWSYNQQSWEQTWSMMLQDAARVLPHDPEGLAELRQLVTPLAKQSVEPVDFLFSETQTAIQKIN